MKRKKEENKRKSELKVMFFIILIAAVMFIISTYAWFSTQKNVSITNLSGTVEVAEGLEISLDAKRWSNGIVLGNDKDAGQLDIIDDAWEGNKNLSPSEMLPVSTQGLPPVGDETVDKANLKMIRGKLNNTIELSEIITMNEDQKDPEKPDFAGYFAFDVFLKNSSKTDAADVLQLNYDSSLEILEAAKTATGLQNTARIAFAQYEGTAEVMADQATILKNTAGQGVGAPKPVINDVAIWEPNSSDHAKYIVENNNSIVWSGTKDTPAEGQPHDTSKWTGDVKTYGSYDVYGDKTKFGFGPITQMPTYALTDAAVGKSMKNIYLWDGTETLLKKQNVLQTTTGKDDEGNVTSYFVEEGVQNLLSTQGDGTTKFTIPANSVCRMRIYLWLEGQDVDCINYASHGGGVKVNIGLVKGSVEGSKGESE